MNAPDRRTFLGTLITVALGACGRSGPKARAATGVPAGELPAFAALEQKLGGRIGFYALDTASGERLAHRADERFAMCSTFKGLLAAAVLARVDLGELSLTSEVPYGPDDLLEYAPFTRAHIAQGTLTVQALAEAAITVSDNTAANLLLRSIDGPAGLTRFFRRIGDSVSRLDRTEPTLNGNAPGDERDTTTPRAMVSALRSVLLGDVLSAASRARLLAWLEACQTGADRLRAGLPSEWRLGHKTGSGENGAVNDVAITWPPNRGPILIASYLSGSSEPPPALEAAHAELARVTAQNLGS